MKKYGLFRRLLGSWGEGASAKDSRIKIYTRLMSSRARLVKKQRERMYREVYEGIGCRISGCCLDRKYYGRVSGYRREWCEKKIMSLTYLDECWEVVGFGLGLYDPCQTNYWSSASCSGSEKAGVIFDEAGKSSREQKSGCA